jgi:Protein of unknown function (DUF2721)
MNSFETNPFGVLTFIVAPAMLTNASSIMALSTSNRYNHAFDRLRNLSELIEHGGTTPDPETAVRLRQSKLAEGRASLLVKALTALYLTVGSFAAASLVSLMGSVFVVLRHETMLYAAQAVALCIGVMGVGGLMTASILLVLETRMTLRILDEDRKFMLARHQNRAHA